MTRTIDHFGLKFCLRDTLSELRSLVNEGLYDSKTKRIITVRIIACLGEEIRSEGTVH